MTEPSSTSSSWTFVISGPSLISPSDISTSGLSTVFSSMRSATESLLSVGVGLARFDEFSLASSFLISSIDFDVGSGGVSLRAGIRGVGEEAFGAAWEVLGTGGREDAFSATTAGGGVSDVVTVATATTGIEVVAGAELSLGALGTSDVEDVFPLMTAVIAGRGMIREPTGEESGEEKIEFNAMVERIGAGVVATETSLIEVIGVGIIGKVGLDRGVAVGATTAGVTSSARPFVMMGELLLLFLPLAFLPFAFPSTSGIETSGATPSPSTSIASDSFVSDSASTIFGGAFEESGGGGGCILVEVESVGVALSFTGAVSIVDASSAVEGDSTLALAFFDPLTCGEPTFFDRFSVEVVLAILALLPSLGSESSRSLPARPFRFPPPLASFSFSFPFPFPLGSVARVVSFVLPLNDEIVGVGGLVCGRALGSGGSGNAFGIV